jgi:hypothetical protein
MSLPIENIAYKSTEEQSLTPLESFLQVIYKTLTQPFTFFQEVATQGNHLTGPYTLFALLIVMLISGMNPVLAYILSGGSGKAGVLFYQVPFQAIVGVIYWLILTNVVGLISYALSGHGHFRQLMILSAFSFIPWMFLAPVSLIKQGIGLPGSILGTVLTFFVLIWTLILYGLTLSTVLKLTMDRALILIMTVLPFAVGMGFVTFFVNGMASAIFRLL